MLEIPVVYLRDKQMFSDSSLLHLLGKPVDFAKKLHEDGFDLIHIIDIDALHGFSTNLDVYDKLTYFVNVEVECAPITAILRKLLSLKCRVVLTPDTDVSAYKEKKLLVAKIPKGKTPEAKGFHDVILASGDEKNSAKYLDLGMRVIFSQMPENKKDIFGVLISI